MSAFTAISASVEQTQTADSTRCPRSSRTPTPPARIFNVRQAAEWLQIHPVTLRRLVERGQLRAAHIGDTLRFREQDLLALFEAAEVAK